MAVTYSRCFLPGPTGAKEEDFGTAEADGGKEKGGQSQPFGWCVMGDVDTENIIWRSGFRWQSLHGRHVRSLDLMRLVFCVGMWRVLFYIMLCSGLVWQYYFGTPCVHTLFYILLLVLLWFVDVVLLVVRACCRASTAAAPGWRKEEGRRGSQEGAFFSSTEKVGAFKPCVSPLLGKLVWHLHISVEALGTCLLLILNVILIIWDIYFDLVLYWKNIPGSSKQPFRSSKRDRSMAKQSTTWNQRPRRCVVFCTCF